MSAHALPFRRPPRAVALVRMSAVGDTVHALPLVASLRRAWPDSHLAWVIQPGPWRLHRGHPGVSEFLLFRRERGPRALWGLRALRDFRRRVRGRRFDLVLDCHPYLKAGLATWCLEADVKLGFDRARARDLSWLFTPHRIPGDGARHVQDRYFEFLEHLGVPVVREWDFHFTAEERRARAAFFARRERPVLAVVLRSSRPGKDWTLEGYARVLETARFDLGLEPVIVGGASRAEAAAAAEVRSRSRAPIVDARADGLRRLAWLLEGSAVALSPDTGPLHIAVALGTPTVGLYGATDPRRSGPYRRFRDLLVDRWTAGGGMERITVREVEEKLERAVREHGRAAPDRSRRAPGPVAGEDGVER